MGTEESDDSSGGRNYDPRGNEASIADSDLGLLFAELKKHERPRRIKDRILKPVVVLSLITPVILLILLAHSVGTNNVAILQAGLMVYIGGLFILRHFLLPTARHKRLMKALSEIDDP